MRRKLSEGTHNWVTLVESTLRNSSSSVSSDFMVIWTAETGVDARGLEARGLGARVLLGDSRPWNSEPSEAASDVPDRAASGCSRCSADPALLLALRIRERGNAYRATGSAPDASRITDLRWPVVAVELVETLLVLATC